MLDHLKGEIVLIAGFAGAVAALRVDTHDVIDTAPVAGDADHDRMRRRGSGWSQQVAEHVQAGPAFEDELLATVRGEVARVQGLRPQCAALRGKSAHEFGDFGAQPLLPGFRLFAVCRAEGELKLRRLIEFTRVKDGVERGGIDLVHKALQRPAILAVRVVVSRGGAWVQECRASGGRQFSKFSTCHAINPSLLFASEFAIPIISRRLHEETYDIGCGAGASVVSSK